MEDEQIYFISDNIFSACMVKTINKQLSIYMIKEKYKGGYGRYINRYRERPELTINFKKIFIYKSTNQVKVDDVDHPVHVALLVNFRDLDYLFISSGIIYKFTAESEIKSFKTEEHGAALIKKIYSAIDELSNQYLFDIPTPDSSCQATHCVVLLNSRKLIVNGDNYQPFVRYKKIEHIVGPLRNFNNITGLYTEWGKCKDGLKFVPDINALYSQIGARALTIEQDGCKIKVNEDDLAALLDDYAAAKKIKVIKRLVLFRNHILEYTKHGHPCMRYIKQLFKNN